MMVLYDAGTRFWFECVMRERDVKTATVTRIEQLAIIYTRF